MKKLHRTGRTLVALALVGAFVFGLVAITTEVQARKGGCVCPQVYAPVVCDKGKVYANQCLADCKRARNCVPVGIF